LPPALRPIALFLYLFTSAAAISQTAGYANIPYTATRKTTYLQKLADGTTITRTNMSTEARDSQGRTMHLTVMSEMQGQTIINTNVDDPVARTNTIWLSQGKQATRVHLPDLHLHHVAQTAGTARASGSTGLGSGTGSFGAFVITSSDSIRTEGYTTVPGITGAVIAGSPRDPNLRPTSHTEKLGGKTIAGVYAEGTRTTVTYPVGYFGNDRLIVTTHETWTSPDLKLLVLSVDDDPRTGTRTTELTNLDRVEPDPALFQVPEGYTIKDQYPGTN
jgi:hypothetical protein